MAKKVDISAEYSDYANVFLKELAAELLEPFDINKYLINLKPGKQPFYKPIYTLDPVELEIFKTYIKTHLANGFIRPFKSPDGVPILFVQKLDSRLRLCMNYQCLNNLTIKNRYFLLLISASVEQLGRAKQFT